LRNAIVKVLNDLAEVDNRLILLVGDIGYGVFEEFQTKYRKNFYNMGIAEANMISVAAGLAKQGFKPVVYTIVPFLIHRAFEQIKIDVALHKLPVTLIGVGGGLAYDKLGPTHHALEDLGVMSQLPNVSIFTPSSPLQAQKSLHHAFSSVKGPQYIRLGKNGEANLLGDDLNESYKSAFNPVIQRIKGENLAIFSNGPITELVEKSISILNSLKIYPALFDVIQRKPVPVDLICKYLDDFDHAVFIEEHYPQGSLFSELMTSQKVLNRTCKLKNLSIPNKFFEEVKSRHEILDEIGLSPDKIASSVLHFWKGM
jgi:transketolase